MASILSRFQKLVSKNFQQTNAEFNKAIYNYIGNSIIWNPENDSTYIEKGYQYNTTIYSIVNLIAKTAATIPFQIYEIKSENELKRYKAMTSGIANGSALHKAEVLRKHALEEVADTELHDLLSRPNPAQSYNAWIQEIIAFGKLTGNRYIYGLKPDTGANKGKFKELYVLPSQKVEINSGGIFDPIKSYSLEYNGQYKMAAEDICHIKDFNPYYDGTGSHLYGMSPLKAGLRSLDTNNEAVTTGAKYLQNQTARGVLMSDEGDINEVQAQQLKEKFRQNYQGSNSAGDIVITPKKLSWINFGMSASDLSLIEQYNASIKDLCNIYSVPAVLLNNTESSTYNNVIEAKNVSKAYDDKLLYGDLNFNLPPAGIVGIIGPNGAGKTTMFRMIMGMEQPDSGTFEVGETVKVSYVDQQHESIDPDKTVWENISDGTETIEIGGVKLNSRAYVSRFNFGGQDQNKKVKVLSGGERNRLHLAMALKQEGNVLLLDEPTNDLDVNTLRALEEGLENFAGCAVIISHDRWFLDRVCTHILAFEGDSEVYYFEGSYSVYEENKLKRLGMTEPKRIRYKKLMND